MSTTRPRALLAAALLAATTALFAATSAQAVAAPTPTPTPTTPTPTPSGEPPSAPGDLRVAAVTPGSVTLSWTASTSVCCAIAGYTVTYAQAYDDVVHQQAVADVTTVTISGTIRATGQYSFSVTARDTAGRSSLSSNYVTVVTPAATTGDTTPPSAPFGLQLTEVTSAGAALTWSPSTDDTGVTGYNVYHWDGWYTSVQAGTTTGTSFVAPLVSSSTGMHYYYVRARDAAGNLSISSAAVPVPRTTTTPTPPARTCTVAYRTTAEWTGGFVAEVTVTNTGTTAVDGWQLTFPVGGDQRVASTWHATFTQAGSTVTLTGERWNSTLQPGASVTAGLMGSWTTSNAAPASAALNGGACTLT